MKLQKSSSPKRPPAPISISSSSTTFSSTLGALTSSFFSETYEAAGADELRLLTYFIPEAITFYLL